MLGILETGRVRELVRSSYNSVTNDVNGTDDAERAQGLYGPIKAGELGLNGQSSTARPLGKTSFDHLS